MALVKRQSNSTKIVIIGLIVVIVAGIGYFAFSQLYLRGANQNIGSGDAGSRAVITNFGESLLNDGRYTELRSFGVNISADANVDAGQPNPFQ